MKIYQLEVVSEKAYEYIYDDDERLDYLDYLNANFNGELLPENWAFPKHKPTSRLFPLYDFINGDCKAPFVSEAVRDTLVTLLPKHIEFRKVAEIKKKNYYLMNVVNLCEFLDHNTSKIKRSDENGRILYVRFVSFKEFKIDPVIFKIPEDTMRIYVTETFVKILIDNRFSGVGIRKVNSFLDYECPFKELPFL